MRLHLDLKVVGDPVLGGWVRCALRGARRTSASQISRKNVLRKAQGQTQATMWNRLTGRMEQLRDEAAKSTQAKE
jgi:23S rRNA maturation mini-RNase III